MPIKSRLRSKRLQNTQLWLSYNRRVKVRTWILFFSSDNWFSDNWFPVKRRGTATSQHRQRQMLRISGWTINPKKSGFGVGLHRKPKLSRTIDINLNSFKWYFNVDFLPCWNVTFSHSLFGRSVLDIFVLEHCFFRVDLYDWCFNLKDNL